MVESKKINLTTHYKQVIACHTSTFSKTQPKRDDMIKLFRELEPSSLNNLGTGATPLIIHFP